ncbi:MAG: glycosyltransferase [Bacteroidales bacterium]
MSHLDFLEAKHPGGWLLRKLISNLHILAVNEKIAARVSRYHPLTITVADAYLPPVFKKEIISNIRVRYSTFFRDDRFIISMNGFFSSYMGIDLYGYDMAAELLSILKKKSIHAYLVACVNGIVNRKIYENFLEKIERNKLSDQVLLIFEAEEAWPFFLLSDVFIRPTCSDGLGVSILEARWAGTPAIASDCIPRPEGTLIFKNRDTDGLAQKVIQVYQEGRKPVENKIRNFRQKPFQSKLIDDIYKISHE